MKFWLAIGAAILGVVLYIDYLKKVGNEKYAARVLACSLSPTCEDEKAQRESRLSGVLVKSSTGTAFFKGSICKDDCSGHVAGYEWAAKRGISKNAGCRGSSVSFVEGCRLYVIDRIAELNSDPGESDGREYESCTPGRYGDC